MSVKRLSLAVAASAGLALSGCGGGSTGSTTAGLAGAGQTTQVRTTPGATAPGATAPGPAQGSTTQGPAVPRDEAFDGPVTAADVAAAIAQAVEAGGASGSVTQSSNVDAGITTDRVSVAAQYGADVPSFALRNGTEHVTRWSIGSDDGAPETIDTAGTGWRGAALRKRVAGGTLYVDAWTDIGAPTTVATDGTYMLRLTKFDDGHSYTDSTWDLGNEPADLDGVAGSVSCIGCSFAYFDGQLTMSEGILTFTPDDGSRPTILGPDTRAEPDADWLAGGIWLFVPDDASGSAKPVAGAFLDGSDPFEQSVLSGLTSGEATYSGQAFGVHSRTADGGTEIGRFTAQVILQAHFDIDEISGRITGFRDENGDLPEENFTVMLGTADIGSQDSGFFSGAASIESNPGGCSPSPCDPPDPSPLSDKTGKWSGQFFGNGEADEPPGSVGGTFGAKATFNAGAANEETQSVIGTFGAGKQ